MVDLEKTAFQKALKKNVKIALGTDAGGFDWKEVNQAKEFEYYVDYGMTPMQAIRTGTVVAADLLGWSDKVGHRRGREVGRHRGRQRRSAERHHRGRAREVCDEGRCRSTRTICTDHSPLVIETIGGVYYPPM